MAPNRGFWGRGTTQDDSIYDQLVAEERRSAARAAGRRVGDLLEAQALEAALLGDQLVVDGAVLSRAAAPETPIGCHALSRF